MIGRLVGQVVARDPGQLLLDVAGVVYELEIPLSTFYRLAESEGPVTIHTHLKADAQLLYGFATGAEKALFRALIKVSNVGPKTALAVLSGLEGSAFADAIQAQDTRLLAGIPGVSKKTAERLVVEMKDKVEAFAGGREAAERAAPDVQADAESALIGLGYKPREASQALAQVESPAEDVETLIKQGLKQLMGTGND